MVMDGQPSPQSVGREFVRQYYTLLNKAPNHLHRFYNNQSSFIHGGLDTQNREATLVVGQKNIHNKIQQLNFRDCHAKISQVDAQATLGNGVVVQVTGELSNDGHPMRRFTQTFVLAAQSPKNYYVHNDIFRYQDLYSDDDNDVEIRSENDEDIENENESSNNSKSVDDSANQQVGQQQPAQPTIFYSMAQSVDTTSAVSGQTVPNSQYSTAATLSNTVPTTTQVNGIVHEDVIQGLQQQQIGQPNAVVLPSATLTVTGNSQAQLNAQQQGIANAIVSTPVAVEVTNAISGTVINQTSLSDIESGITNITTNDFTNLNDSEPKEDYRSIEPIVEKVEVVKPVNEPKTYANLFKTTNVSSSGSGFVPLPPVSHQTTIQSSYKQEIRSEPVQLSALPQRNNSRANNKDFTERRSSNNNQQIVDSHQLFLGNVPHHATEDDLKVLFGKFGQISDLRLHSKAGAKVPGLRNPPNYGFITYEDPDSVQKCLSNCPIYYPENSPEGQKLNVEEKKTRVRTDIPPPRQSNMTNNNVGPGGIGGGGNSSQRPSGGGGGGGQNRSLSNSGGGGMMRGSGGNGIMRGSSGGPRPSGGGFNRNDNRGGPGGPGGSQSRGGNGNSTSNTGGNSYGRR